MAAIDSTTELITNLCEYRVTSGPFAGMRYETEAVHSAHLPKLLGCYEQELHACLERFLLRPYQRIINIGCGEGYYAVGLAMRLPQAQIHAFDTEPRAQELCRALAVANGVAKRIHVHEGCTIEALRKVLKPGTLIVCDCEGCEIELLRPDLLPGAIDPNLALCAIEVWSQPVVADFSELFTHRPGEGANLLRAVGTNSAGASLQRHYHLDALGSVEAITGSSQSVETTYRTDAWGNVLSGSAQDNPAVYLGGLGYWNEPTLGLDYVRARWLNPATGSWLSVDPVTTEPRYRYAANSPTMRVDPSGQQEHPGMGAPKGGSVSVQPRPKPRSRSASSAELQKMFGFLYFLNHKEEIYDWSVSGPNSPLKMGLDELAKQVALQIHQLEHSPLLAPVLRELNKWRNENPLLANLAPPDSQSDTLREYFAGFAIGVADAFVESFNIAGGIVSLVGAVCTAWRVVFSPKGSKAKQALLKSLQPIIKISTKRLSKGQFPPRRRGRIVGNLLLNIVLLLLALLGVSQLVASVSARIGSTIAAARMQSEVLASLRTPAIAELGLTDAELKDLVLVAENMRDKGIAPNGTKSLLTVVEDSRIASQSGMPIGPGSSPSIGDDISVMNLMDGRLPGAPGTPQHCVDLALAWTDYRIAVRAGQKPKVPSVPDQGLQSKFNVQQPAKNFLYDFVKGQTWDEAETRIVRAMTKAGDGAMAYVDFRTHYDAVGHTVHVENRKGNVLFADLQHRQLCGFQDLNIVKGFKQYQVTPNRGVFIAVCPAVEPSGVPIIRFGSGL